VIPRRLREKCFLLRSATSAAKQDAEKLDCSPQSFPQRLKAGIENSRVIAAVNRCATQSKNKIEFFSKFPEKRTARKLFSLRAVRWTVWD